MNREHVKLEEKRIWSKVENLDFTKITAASYEEKAHVSTVDFSACFFRQFSSTSPIQFHFVRLSWLTTRSATNKNKITQATNDTCPQTAKKKAPTSCLHLPHTPTSKTQKEKNERRHVGIFIHQISLYPILFYCYYKKQTVLFHPGLKRNVVLATLVTTSVSLIRARINRNNLVACRCYCCGF